MTMSLPTEASGYDETFDEVCRILCRVLEVELDDLEIEPESVLTDDLGLESIDLVAIGAMLADRYGPQVNLAAYLAELSIDDVIVLRVGNLVELVLSSGVAAERAVT